MRKKTSPKKSSRVGSHRIGYGSPFRPTNLATRSSHKKGVSSKAIKTGIKSAVSSWTRHRNALNQIEISPGAIDTLTLMISNIASDQSASWKDIDVVDIQAKAIANIPQALDDLEKMSRGKYRVITSWELLHGLTPLLNKWCPVSKDL